MLKLKILFWNVLRLGFIFLFVFLTFYWNSWTFKDYMALQKYSIFSYSSIVFLKTFGTYISAIISILISVRYVDRIIHFTKIHYQIKQS
jgi:hypothetical protein